MFTSTTASMETSSKMKVLGRPTKRTMEEVKSDSYVEESTDSDSDFNLLCSERLPPSPTNKMDMLFHTRQAAKARRIEHPTTALPPATHYKGTHGSVEVFCENSTWLVRKVANSWDRDTLKREKNFLDTLRQRLKVDRLHDHYRIVDYVRAEYNKAGNLVGLIYPYKGIPLDRCVLTWSTRTSKQQHKSLREDLVVVDVNVEFEALMQSLLAVHSVHALHTDIKSNNIVVDQDRHAWLIDWGEGVIYPQGPTVASADLPALLCSKVLEDKSCCLYELGDDMICPNCATPNTFQTAMVDFNLCILSMVSPSITELQDEGAGCFTTYAGSSDMWALSVTFVHEIVLDLSKGDATCQDKCVQKYMHAWADSVRIHKLWSQTDYKFEDRVKYGWKRYVSAVTTWCSEYQDTFTCAQLVLCDPSFS